MQLTYQPNPYEERIKEVMRHSESIKAEAGDLVWLETAPIVAFYREKKRKDEEFDFMIDHYVSLAGPVSEFRVLSCGDVFTNRYSHCIKEIIRKQHQVPHPCYVWPCPLEKAGV